jgi:hypothetical protein
VKLSKCEFAQQQLEYLRHIISKDGVAIDPKKTKVMREWHVPKATIELRGFFGLTSYLQKICKGVWIDSQAVDQSTQEEIV